MNVNAKALQPLYINLNENIKNNKVYQLANGDQFVEILGAEVELDPKDLYVDFNSRKTPRDYVSKELRWYLSESSNIELVGDVKIWSHIADVNREVNSNYGKLVFSRDNFSQFNNVLNKLLDDEYTRQAIIIYTRPSIHYEYNSFHASDFICTNFQHFFIRDNKLNCITSMRSQDCIYGTFNDIPWFHFVIQHMFIALHDQKYANLELGYHKLIVNSFHAYKKHFKLVSNIAEEEEV